MVLFYFVLFSSFYHFINVHLALVVDVVEVLSDPRLGTLALGVPSGCSGAGGQTPAPESRKPERQHGQQEPQREAKLRVTLARVYLL